MSVRPDLSFKKHLQLHLTTEKKPKQTIKPPREIERDRERERDRQKRQRETQRETETDREERELERERKNKDQPSHRESLDRENNTFYS